MTMTSFDETNLDERQGNAQHHFRNQSASPLHLSCYTPSMVATSKAETILISSAGDVLISRCRSVSFRSETEPKCQDDVAMLCCEAQCDDLTTQLGDSAMLCSPWKGSERPLQRGGLLGGAPAQVAPYSEPSALKQSANTAHWKGKGVSPVIREEKKGLPASSAQLAFRNKPLADSGFDDESIIPIMSFDYSHFADGGNDMLPPPNTVASRSEMVEGCMENKPFKLKEAGGYARETDSSSDTHSRFMFGVPTFAPSFAQVKITQLSANPLGSHVLLISNAGLLYSYGRNTHGQLGIGLKGRGSASEFVFGPTIVTPLIENGGKAIACAAGVNHSLVVVATEVRRLIKSQSTNQMHQREEGSMKSEVHHQLYGFGRNDFMKIGLVSPKLSKAGAEDEMDNVILPRRVALRCQISQESSSFHDDSNPPHGIFSVQASAEHSAALVRRASGDVELYTWGNATHGALGIPQAITDFEQRKTVVTAAVSSPVRVVPVPSFVAALSRSSNKHAKSSSALMPGEYPAHIALGRTCSFVTTSNGRCFSFGVSEEGMLGLGKDHLEAFQPTEIAFPPSSNREHLVKVSVGAHHVTATTKSGNVFSWGEKLNAGLSDVRFETNKMDPFQWSPCRLSFAKDQNAKDSQENGKTADLIVEAVAGFDNSVFVTSTGAVFSCGKASGRLCQGDVHQDVCSPRRIYGGLRLFNRTTSENTSKPKNTEKKPRAKLRRGLTVQ